MDNNVYSRVGGGRLVLVGCLLVLAAAGVYAAGHQAPAVPSWGSGPAAPSGGQAAGGGSAVDPNAPVPLYSGPNGSMVVPEVHHGLSRPLREIPPLLPVTSGKPRTEKNEGVALADIKGGPDPVLQQSFHPFQGLTGPVPQIPAPTISFNGLNFQTAAACCLPPDTDGAVGPNHFVQLVNSALQVFNKNGTSAAGPVQINSLWSDGSPCKTRNDGDPITLYDRQANRFIISQFTSKKPYYECIAVSQTSNPTGAWYTYSFDLLTGTTFADYPHFGAWPDGYYMSANMFAPSYGGPKPFVFDRIKMLQGQAATFQTIGALGNTHNPLMPADLDGPTAPPTGEANLYLEYGNPIQMYRYHVDWVTPANTTWTAIGSVTPAAFTGLAQNSIPEPAGGSNIDSLGDRFMFRLAYRNFGDHEGYVINHSVVAGTSGAPRWYELRSTPVNTNPTLYQQGTYNPDAVYRWMGSTALDHFGDQGLAYSVSDASSTYPGIRYTARLLTDTLGVMPQGEGTLFTGAADQTIGTRWGDYSQLTLDPVDDCTFWFTSEYAQNGGTNPGYWATRIGSFKLPSCAIQAMSALTGTGAALSPPGILWNGATGQIFIGSNSGVKQLFTYTGAGPFTAAWTASLTSGTAANQGRGPIVAVNGANRVFETSQDGWLTGLTASSGALFWQKQLASGLGGNLLVAAPAYLGAGTGPSGQGLLFVGTYTTTAATNAVYALDAANGNLVWTFTNGGVLGNITTVPMVDWTNRRLYFGTNAVGGTGGGVWSLDALTGALRWSNTTSGNVVSSAPTLSGDNNTLYIGTVNGGTNTFSALRAATTGTARWSTTAPGQFNGAVWVDSSGLYAAAGNQVLAYTDNGVQTSATPKWAGVAVPGAGTPASLALAGKSYLVAPGSDGNLYQIDLATGTVNSRGGPGPTPLKVGPTALSDVTYDYLRDALYMTVNGILYAIPGNF